jgi:hypothetical protein
LAAGVESDLKQPAGAPFLSYTFNLRSVRSGKKDDFKT